jgi:hypothetical protein
MARPIVVIDMTTVGGAEFGPIQNHEFRNTAEWLAMSSASEARDAAMQIVLVRAFDFRGDDLADTEWTTA